jgi:hypothetical protein
MTPLRSKMIEDMRTAGFLPDVPSPRPPDLPRAQSARGDLPRAVLPRERLRLIRGGEGLRPLTDVH